MTIKESLIRDFFVNQFPLAPEYPIGVIFFFLFTEIFSTFCLLFITGVNDTGNKLFTCVRNIADKLSQVSLLPVINLLPVSITPAIAPCLGF
jgi:hypothetical protein